MTNEERDLISAFIQRVGGVPSAQPGAVGGSVPNAGPGAAAPLPPVDRDADMLIASLFERFPEARYRITQMAFVQEHALVEAQNRINRLEWELNNARQQAAQPAQAPASSPWGAQPQQQPQPQPQQSRGLFGGLFGGGSAPPPQPQQQPQYAPPPPQYAPGYNPGMFQRGGSGFLGSALTTAAGVAGGMVAGNALMNLFGGHHGGGFGSPAGFGAPGGFGGGGGFVPVAPSAESAWGGGGNATDPYDAGGPPKDDGSDKFAGTPQVDNGPWVAPDAGGGDQQPVDSPDFGGGTDDGGGWTDTSDGGGDWTDNNT
jgi:uncharacterized protein